MMLPHWQVKGARWRRRFLKETTQSDMGSKWKALIRPAPTRFCGYSYMLSREEEVKPSLQRVVVSQQYAAHNFDRQEGGDPAKDLILSSDFWRRARATTSLTLPIVKKLRFFDTDAPTNSKVYKTMFNLGEGFKDCEAAPQAWKDKAAELSGKRWEYAHSVFHAAGYALDPEYHEELMKEGLDQEGLEAVKDGLETVVERLALREELKDRSQAIRTQTQRERGLDSDVEPLY